MRDLVNRRRPRHCPATVYSSTDGLSSPPAGAVFVWGLIRGAAWVVGVFLTVLSAYDIYFLTHPEVTVPENESPFVLPFIVKNPSHLFDMVDTSVACTVPGMRVKKLDNLPASVEWRILPGVGHSTIKSGRSDAFSCAVSTTAGAGALQVLQAIAEIKVSYKTFGFDRVPHEVRLEWHADAKPPRWIETNEKMGQDVPNIPIGPRP